MVRINKVCRDASRELKPLSDKSASLHIDRKFSAEEFETIAMGLDSLGMEDKWIILEENLRLYFYRSWTGTCIYQLQFEKQGSHYLVLEALVSRNENEYKETDIGHDQRLVLFLIDNLLLGNKTAFPLRKKDKEQYEKGVVQHNFSGTAYPERITDK